MSAPSPPPHTPTPSTAPATAFEWFQRSPFARVLSILLLVLVLRIPVAMVRELIQERQQRRDHAVAEVTGKWGREQSVIGPILVVPYTEPAPPRPDGTSRVVARTAFFLPEALEVRGRAESRTLGRGIFDVPVYGGELSFSGRFAPPDFSDWNVPPERVQWDRAQIAVAISDPRVIQESMSLDLEGVPLAFEAGIGRSGADLSGVHVNGVESLADGGAFAFSLRLHGSEGLYFAPLGRETTVRLASNWPHPSFQGQWLPSERTVGEDGFEAVWHVPYLGRSYPQRWASFETPGDRVEQSRFGVAFETPIDPYRLSLRSVKYDSLFLGLTFLSLWLFEVLAGVRVHAVQYGMVGGAMALFYLLLLAFSEHFGFALAYGVAASGVIGLIGAYAIAMLRRRGRGLAIGGVAASLYGYLYVLLHNQDHALLVGSVGLFAILGGVMWLTRHVDWERVASSPAEAES